MCGIAGFVGAAADDVVQARQQLETMIGSLAHRGPDGFGYYTGEGVALAHARLSIIDLATGDQPIHNEDRTCWVVFNGEIFNYIELRASLEAAGHRFYTRSDTEVIVHLYEEHGDAFVLHLNGQFAIALWDTRAKRLVLARDRAGIRPLYYLEEGRNLWFGSEVKALFAALPGRARIDLAGLAEALSLWSAVDPQTLFQGVRSVPPGHVLVVDADGARRLQQYWDWEFPERGGSPIAPARALESCVEDLLALLVDAVALQLRADVPVGAYLSGGLDSAGIAALAHRVMGSSLQTFSVAFEDGEFDESGYQQAMAMRLGTRHTSFLCRRADIGAIFPSLIWHTETPILRTAAAPLMMLSGKVREAGIKVVLTGEGADEVFAGYDLYKEAKVRRFWSRQPQSKLRPKLLRRLYGYLDASAPGHALSMQAFFERGLGATDQMTFGHQPRWNTSSRSLTFLSAEARASLGTWQPARAFEARLPERLARCSPLARDQYVEAKSLLAGYLLSSQGDRVAMANSIEARYPYLDHRVIEFGNGLPDRYKLRGLTEKHILRRALAGVLPAELVQRPKQPYRAPDSECFFEDGRPLPFVEDLLSADRLRAAGYFDPRAVGRLVDKCRSGRVRGFSDNQAFVGILSTMLVDDLFVRQRTL